MDVQKKIHLLFFAAPIALITIVFFVTYTFSRFLDPLGLCIPLLVAYYGTIWSFIGIYQKKMSGGNPVLKYSELKPSFKRLGLWMLIWTIGYPVIVGLLAFYRYAPNLTWIWIIIGVPFSLINGPSEEIFWRLFMERIGKDGALNKNIRLIYSSVTFGLWHFIFVIFLMPKDKILIILPMAIGITTLAGFLWMMVYQKTGNMFPNIFSHSVLNFLQIWPWAASSILGANPHFI